MKLFENNFSDIEHVEEYLWAAERLWNYFEIILAAEIILK